MEDKELDQFVSKIIKIGDSLGVIIPSRVVQFSGLKEHDLLKIWFKKQEEIETIKQ